MTFSQKELSQLQRLMLQQLTMVCANLLCKELLLAIPKSKTTVGIVTITVVGHQCMKIDNDGGEWKTLT